MPLQEKHEACTVAGCERKHEAKGFCRSHYDRWRMHGDPLARTKSSPTIIENRGDHLALLLEGKHGAGRECLVDLEQKDFVTEKRFFCNAEGYVLFKENGKRTLLHRFLLGLVQGDSRQCDHVDGDPLNNRRENLRIVTYEQNMQNKKPWGRTGHRNVTWEEAKQLYRVVVTKDGKKHSGGRHKNLEDAVEAARVARSTFHASCRRAL